MATSITVAQAIAYENDPSTIPAGAVFDLVDIAANIETLTATEISQLSSVLGVSSITATDAPVTFTPGGPEQAALKSAGISITAEINVTEALALEQQTTSSGTPLLAPPVENIIVLDTAANLETMTRAELRDLSNVADTVKANGTPTTNSAVTQIAGTDAPPVFSAVQMKALGNAEVVVATPPNDPGQNDGTAVITGRGLTFDITWDSSVASAPDAFKTDVEEVFQLYADTYAAPAGPTTLYFNIGFGEFNNTALDSTDLGENEYFHVTNETYAHLLSRLTADATSPAQLAALATLPPADPTSNNLIEFSPAQAQILGFANAPTSSATDPDGYVGFSDTADWNYSADPNQTPVSGQYDFIGTVEHEISEVMGRTSDMGNDFSNKESASGDFSLMDLYRYTAPGTRALSPFTDPSYFSIDNGTTNLADWNNYTTGDNGDLGDWSGTTVGGVVKHTADSFNDDSNPGIINPFTATDATLMNVLGYDFAAPPPSPLPLASNKIAISAGQLLEYITLNEINPGSVNPPAGDSYVVIDIQPVCIKAGALGINTPRRDLWISPHHAMYFDSTFFAGDGGMSAGGALIEAKDLVNGTSIVQAEHAGKVEYFHIELETHDVIVAEGALSETFIDDDSRGMFHNAPEFHALYPRAARTAAQYCAPRLEDGYEVEAVRRRIAGLVPAGDFALAG
jgi:Hint domain